MRRARKINPAHSLLPTWRADYIIGLLSKRTEQPAPLESRLETPCWIWSGYCDPQGYGQVRYLGKMRWIHRVAYTLMRGKIPAGMEIGHKCRCRSCFNPAHLKKTSVNANRIDIVRRERERERERETCSAPF